ncbi:DNL zinc finger domain containing protein [Theileria equi strain WA]|uniref:DNL zinc finger domain containing protein n=1 Tax=Theileria equi strain WA TaxID=1537102 RepID=L0AYY1_THEEQ|nr:DNL zinc finger domain containing protein [Theileria equi strain WA]AFZ80104.1 DNL zinc finger domain containing protein [Theileria equi strain WA]|eukprot:XP_004829770.1 DNL zinc finger domain containing protein [Theileria equi strain WA]
MTRPFAGHFRRSIVPYKHAVPCTSCTLFNRTVGSKNGPENGGHVFSASHTTGSSTSPSTAVDGEFCGSDEKDSETTSDAPEQSGGATLQASKPERYIAVFTCNICQYRSAKTFSKRAYHHGVVYVKCAKCSSLHLISDQLGWFGDEKKNIEQILAEKNESVSKAELGQEISQDDLSLIVELKKQNRHFN